MDSQLRSQILLLVKVCSYRGSQILFKVLPPFSEGYCYWVWNSILTIIFPLHFLEIKIIVFWLPLFHVGKLASIFIDPAVKVILFFSGSCLRFSICL